MFLAACGGGGGGDDDPAPTQSENSNGNDNAGPNGNGTSSPNGGTANPPSGGGTPPSAGSGDGGSTPPSTDSGSDGGSTASPTTPAAGSFAATVTQAPANGATIRGTVRILVEGSGIRNVELLPATGYTPLAARGTVTGDNVGAYIDFDTTVLSDGPITLRVAAFNAPPGEGGSEITAMPARTWTIQNGAAQTFTAQLVSAPPEVQPADDQPSEFVVSGTNLGNVELVSAKDESIIYGRFTISANKTRATLPWDHGAQHNGKVYDTYQLRVLAWDVPPGEAGRKIEVMAPRTFRGSYNPGCQPCGGEAP